MVQGGQVTRRRLIVIAVCLLFWGGALGTRLFYLHVVKASDYRQRAADQHLRELDISPQRGAIRDRNGNDLAISIEVDSLYAVPARVQDPGATATFLAPVLNDSIESIRAKLLADRSFVWLKRKLAAAQSAEIRAAGRPGLDFQKESKRFYPNVQLASHVLGFVNLDNHGVAGLEWTYDELIGGTPGRIVVQRDAHNVGFERLERSPTEGASLTTTLDTNIQHFVEEEIQRTIRETAAVGMTVIVMEPNSGGILAMANYPTFNPNEYARSPEVNWTNRAIKHGYEPGSTFKVATAAAVLEEDLAEIDEVVDGQNGGIVVEGYRIRDHQPFGKLSVRQVLQYSSNVGIIKLGTRLGDVRFARYIERFGFGSPTGIDLMGEEQGLVRDPSAWSGLSSSVISMGQEILTTPLQVLNLLAAVANGGTLYRPFVVSRIDHIDGRTEETVPEGRRVMSRQTASLLQDALAGVVTDGTGRPAAIPGYTSAGKTGTAQKIDPATGTYSATRHVASFAGYAPRTNPAIAVIVVIDEPRGEYHGGAVAGPVFGRVAARILRALEVPPDVEPPARDYTEDEAPITPGFRVPASEPAMIPAVWMPAERTSQSRELSSPVASALEPIGEPGSGRFPAPDLLGRPLRDVFADMTQLGLHLVSSGSGVAVEQWPAPGALVAPDSRIEVRFSTASRASSGTDVSTP